MALKYYAFLGHWSDFEYCIEFMRNVYIINNRQSCLNRDILAKNAKLTLIMYKILTIVYSIVALGMIVIPLIVSLWSGEKVYILPAKIPGINEATSIAFSVTALYHTTLVLIVLMGSFVSDFSIVGFLMNAWALSQIFRNGFSDLNDTMADDQKFVVRNLVRRHQEFRM